MGKRIYAIGRRIFTFILNMFTSKLVAAHKEQIAYLKDEIQRLIKEREVERQEYKRAIDVLLQQKQLPMIGQGVAPTSEPFNPMKMLAYMEEEVPVERKS